MKMTMFSAAPRRNDFAPARCGRDGTFQSGIDLAPPAELRVFQAEPVGMSPRRRVATARGPPRLFRQNAWMARVWQARALIADL